MLFKIRKSDLLLGEIATFHSPPTPAPPPCRNLFTFAFTSAKLYGAELSRASSQTWICPTNWTKTLYWEKCYPWSEATLYLEMNGPTEKGENPSYLIFITEYCLCCSNKCLLIFSQSRGYFKQQSMIFYKEKPIKNTILGGFNELIRMFNSSWLCWVNNYNIYFTYVKYLSKIIAPYV